MRSEGADTPAVLVVGAGFAGATCARVLADAGRRVLVVDRRDYVCGNAHDHLDAHGVLVHRHGPHIFHTNSERVFAFLSRFTDWRPYEHRTLACVEGQLLPIPINRTTINRLYGLDLDEGGARAFLKRVREPCSEPRTSEDVVLSRVGRDLCERFFRGYTRKQWGVDLAGLAPEVAGRIPVRYDEDDRYFTDTYQCMPAEGYGALFARMLDHPRIRVELGRAYEPRSQTARWSHVVYTGPIDAWFGHCHGRLPYRSLEFVQEHLADRPWFQPSGTVNYPNDHEYTRITEFKHLTGQVHPGTSIARELPRAEGPPYYPIPCPESAQRYARYQELARAERGVTFVGRLAQYRYLNMDQVVGAALGAADRLLGGSA